MAKYLVLIPILIISTVSAHSNIGSPLAYNPTSCKASTSWCKGACPPIWKSGKGKARNSIQNPPATWRRGQSVEIIWHKNNHVGGFYRRSLVPVDHMFDHEWHKKTAFDFGCWQQGTFQCGKGPKCGFDQKGKSFKNRITVPDVFPNGNYVFAHVWYGGLYWKGTYPKYSDYFACSFVRIQGGNPLKAVQSATFTGTEMKCPTGATKPLQCGGESCGDKCGLQKCPKNSVQVSVPDEWKNGAVPKVFLSKVDPKAKAGTVSVSQTETASEQKKKIAKEEKTAAAEVPVPAEEKAAMKDKKKDLMNDMKEGREAATQPLPQKYMKGPLKSVRIFLDNVMYPRELMDGDKAAISLKGKSITFEGWTAGEKVGKMYFEINGRRAWRESSSPYVFMGNRDTMYKAWKKPIMNKEFTLGLNYEYKGKRYSITTKLILRK